MSNTDFEYRFQEEKSGFPEPAKISHGTSMLEQVAWGVIGVGLVCFTLVAFGFEFGGGWTPIALAFFLPSVGASILFWERMRHSVPGIKHDNTYFRDAQNRGFIGWGLGILLTGFYVVLYFYDDVPNAGAILDPLTSSLEPLSQAMRGTSSDRWFLYGFMYTLAILTFGVRMFMKYRNNRYQLVRTTSVMFFQLGFAFLIPGLLQLFHQPEFYFSYFWPLKYSYLWPKDFSTLLHDSTQLGVFMIIWSTALALIGVPLLTYFFGKRWYCSWVCGCGGLAETVGDPWRQQSSKSTLAWKIERVMIHSVLVLVVGGTILLWVNSAQEGAVLGEASAGFSKWYGFIIGATFSGVVGVGFYPLLGSRVWCRFGCPLAAILGLFQRTVSRFRITVNGGQCMSCGNCSTYCEMGIDVRAYAERSENIIRASCVGCGVCSAVCPRGVLKLENGPTHGGRFEGSEKPAKAFVESFQGTDIYGYEAWWSDRVSSLKEEQAASKTSS